MKRTPLKRKTRLRAVSAKRRLALRDRVRAGTACELCEHLAELTSYRAFASAYQSPHWYLIREPHHVFTPPRWDHPANVVTVCRVCHDFCHECWGSAGRLVATLVLMHAGRFDREMTRERWSGGDPIAAIQADYDAGLFASDPALLELAWAVFEGH